MAHDLINAQKISSEWPGSDAGWNALAESLRHEYARARKEFESARAAPSDQRLHGLRKRSKSLLYVCEFLGTVSPYAKAKSTQLNRLAVCLGNFHDLWLLKHANIPEHIEEKAGTKRRALQQRALRLGANIYCDSPGTFTKCVRKEWKKHR
jgi:CHAD domain-containing protein